MESILEARELTRVYLPGEDNQVRALNGASLSVRKGEFLAIVGHSGSGKSTLLHLLGGLDRPTSGTVSIEGTDLSRLSETELTLFRRRRTGFVFQVFNLLPDLSVRENLAIPYIIAGRQSEEDRDRIEDLIELFGLRGTENRASTQLSTGEQQRIAIARAFLTRPTIIMADEPTGNLDFTTGVEILQLMWESCDNFEQTVLVVSHNPRIGAFADRVLFLSDGVIVDELEQGRHEDHDDTRPILNRLQRLGL